MVKRALDKELLLDESVNMDELTKPEDIVGNLHRPDERNPGYCFPSLMAHDKFRPIKPFVLRIR